MSIDEVQFCGLMLLTGIAEDTANLPVVHCIAEFLEIPEVDDMHTLSSDGIKVTQESPKGLWQSTPQVCQVSLVDNVVAQRLAGR